MRAPARSTTCRWSPHPTRSSTSSSTPSDHDDTQEVVFAMTTVTYRSIEVKGVKVFYRESGPSDAAALLLLHGYPSAGHMFRNLIPQLADRFRVIAPDLPAFGQSDMPERTKFSYT